MGTQGVATIDFGTTPVSEATIAVTGQAGFTSANQAEAHIEEDSTADNPAVYHRSLAALAKAFIESKIAGGFTIRVQLLCGLATGTFKIPWVWN